MKKQEASWKMVQKENKRTNSFIRDLRASRMAVRINHVVTSRFLQEQNALHMGDVLICVWPLSRANFFSHTQSLNKVIKKDLGKMLFTKKRPGLNVSATP